MTYTAICGRLTSILLSRLILDLHAYSFRREARLSTIQLSRNKTRKGDLCFSEDDLRKGVIPLIPISRNGSWKGDLLLSRNGSRREEILLSRPGSSKGTSLLSRQGSSLGTSLLSRQGSRKESLLMIGNRARNADRVELSASLFMTDSEDEDEDDDSFVV